MYKPESRTPLHMRVRSSLGHRGKIPLTFMCALSPSDLVTLAFLSVQWPEFNGKGEKQLHSDFVRTWWELREGGFCPSGGERRECRFPISWTRALTIKLCTRGSTHHNQLFFKGTLTQYYI